MRVAGVNLLIALLLVAGLGWTLYAGLVLGQPDCTTCRLVYPQMRQRPVLACLFGVVAWGLMQAGAPELPRWKSLLYLLAAMASGHLVWPED